MNEFQKAQSDKILACYGITPDTIQKSKEQEVLDKKKKEDEEKENEESKEGAIKKDDTDLGEGS